MSANSVNGVDFKSSCSIILALSARKYFVFFSLFNSFIAWINDTEKAELDITSGGKSISPPSWINDADAIGGEVYDDYDEETS